MHREFALNSSSTPLSSAPRAGFLGIALCLAACQPSPTRPPSEDPFGRAVDALFEPWNRDDSPGAAVVILQDGKPLYRRGFGLSSLEDGTPITVDGTRFEKCSNLLVGFIVLEL